MSIWQRLFGHEPDHYVAWAAIAIAVVLAWALTQFAARLVGASLIGAAPAGGAADGQSGHRRALRTLVRVIRFCMVLLLTGVFVPPVLELLGEPLRDGLRLTTLTHWLLNSGLRVLLIAVLAVLVIRASGIGVARLESYMAASAAPDAPEQAKRAKTIGDLIRNVVRAFTIATAGLMILGELDVNTAPLLTSAGILGLAIGFGAQTLVKDVISGFFIILENQVRVGDVAEINGTGGVVEAITLRTLVMRDARGAVHVFPCGSVSTLANLTKDFSFAVLDIHVDYKHDTDEVVEVIRKVADGIRADPVYAASVTDPVEILGVENLGDTGVTIRARMRTVPHRQWDVTRELRRRIKKAFSEGGIDIPIVTPPGTTRK